MNDTKYSFFLYGVYDTNQVCHSRFKDLIVSQRPAQVRGSIYRLSGGMGLFDPQGESWISGSFVEIAGPESLLSILDALCGFDPNSLKNSIVVRKEVPTYSSTEDTPTLAHVYCVNLERRTSAKLLAENEVEAFGQQAGGLVDRLTERHKTYIQKLSQAKGREIVPVDMVLYRELMALELIVDKGRRLALSRQGTEISWFL